MHPQAEFLLEPPSVRAARRQRLLVRQWAELLDTLIGMHRDEDWWEVVDESGTSCTSLLGAVHSAFASPQAVAWLVRQPLPGRALPRLNVAAGDGHLALSTLVTGLRPAPPVIARRAGGRS